MTKRRKLILEAVILTAGFIAIQFVDINIRYLSIGFLGLLTYFLTAQFLKPDIKKISWLVVLPPATLYVVFFCLFNFLLPANILLKVLIVGLFWLGTYAVLLTENIFSIASSFRTIQLIRAAQAVGFFLTLITAFLGFNTVFSFRSFSWINGFYVFFITLPLVLASIWSIVLEEKLNLRIVIYGLIIGLLMAQTAVFISFWPLSIMTASLFLVSFLYVVLGIVQSFFAGKLFKNTLREFLQVGIIIFLITYFLAVWR